MTPPEASSAREVTRRLTAEASQSGSPGDAATAAHAACERVYRGLSLWLGASGAHALFTRAFAEARVTHPAVRDVRLHKSESRLDGVPESIQSHGASAVAAGLEAVLVAVLELLGRLLGPDVAARLVEQSVPDDPPDEEIAV